MSLRKYEALVKTVELGSLSKAADVIGCTQSAMSHTLSALEDELGFSVLVRGRNGIRLTAAGEKLYPKLVEIINMKQEIDDLSSQIAGGVYGVVRVGAFTSVAVNWLPGILKEYQALYPAVEIQMMSGDYHDIDVWLEKGDIDIGFIALPAPFGISSTVLKEDPLMVVLPKGHELERFTRIPIELAAKEPIISLLETSSQDIHRALDHSGLKPDVKYVTKDDYAIIAMVRAGLGISIMPSLLIKGNDSDISVRKLSPEASRTIALGYNESRKHIPAVQSFAKCVEKWVKENA